MNRLPSLVFSCVALASCADALAQVAINADQSDPDASAMLDVKATDKGVLVPRLTALQRDAIASPATGLLVYVSDAGVFNYHDGSLWRVVGEGAVDLTDYLSGSDLANIASIAGPIPSAGPLVADAASTVATDSTGANGGKWQSFVAQRSGALASVQLHFVDSGTTTFTSFQIYTNTDPASPYLGGTLLYTRENFNGTGPWVSVDLDPVVSVVAGQRYFIVIDATGNWQLNTSGTDAYADGRASGGALNDYAFSTFVRPPVATLAVDSTTGDVALAGGALSMIGAGPGRLRFDAETGAIHGGVTDQAGYEAENGGSHSVAFGRNVLASGENAFAIGDTVTASGQLSFAAGRDTVASGKLSLALGDPATASAQASVAIGDRARAGDLILGGVSFPGLAVGAVAMGKNVNANGLGAFAIGQDTTAIGTLSLAFGNQARTEGENAFAVGNRAEAHGERSVALGDRVKAYGDASVALGLRNNAQSYAEFVVGSYTPDYVPASTTAWHAADRLFVVGNGPDSSNRSTALVVYKSGDATLKGRLTLTNGDDGITFPNTDGAAGQILATDGDGNLSWVAGPAGDLAGITSLSGPAASAPGADASSEIGGEAFDLHDGEARQTFTALASGRLRTLELDFYVALNSAPATVAIYAGDHAINTPPGSPLVSQSISVTAPGWFALDLGTGVTVSAGEVYTIVVTLGDTAEPAFWSQATGEDPYAGGRASTGASDDFHFRTAVAPPADVALLALDSASGQISLGNGNVIVDSSDSPDHALTVNGSLRVADGTQAAGRIAISDTNGTLAWVDPASVTTAPDGDASPTNELQTLSLSGDTLALSDGGSVDLGAYLDNTDAQTLSLDGTDLTLSNGGGTVSINDADSDPANELQNLSSSASGTNRTININGGTGTTINVADNDNSATNELQTVSRSGNTVTLSNSGGSFNLGQLSSLSILNATGETNSMLFQGQSNQDMWINFRSGGSGTIGTAGAIFSRFGTSHFFAANTSNALDISYSTEDSDNPDLANATRLVRLGTDGSLAVGNTALTAEVDVSGTLQVRGGSPLLGKALIATGTDGTADWRYPSLNAGSAFISSVGSVAGGTSGWQDVGVTQSQFILPDLEVGDRVMMMVSCRVRVGGSTGTDDYSFRFAALPGAFATFANMAPTGLLENLDQHRNQWQELSFHRVATVSGAGHTIISLQVNMDNANDTIEFTDIELTAYKL